MGNSMSTSAIVTNYRNPRSIGLLVGFVLLVVVVGGVIGAGNLPDAWYTGLAKAPWNPPNWVFGPAWFLLYVLIGIAGWRTFLRAPRSVEMALWVGQLLLNWAWSPTWFTLHAIWPAYAIIVAMFVLIVGFIVLSWRRDRLAAWLFVPYALWVAFASTLNLAVALLNPA